MFLSYLLFVLVASGVQSCRYHTFSNISVILRGAKRPASTIHGCFGPEPNLDRVSFIQILNQTVPVLYEDAFNNLEYLLDIVLEHNGIRDIRPKTFKNLPKIYLIKLRNIEIRKIDEDIFNNLSLSELNLANNKIERIHSNAFDNLPNLNIILLSGNRLSTWDPNWFKGTPKLTVLNFENNVIGKLPQRAFQNIYGLHLVNNLNVSTSIHLNNNKIRDIEDWAFEGLETLGWLFLQQNEIQVINEQSLGHLKQLDWLRLEYNNLECIPETLVRIAPNVKYYLEGNPLTEDCMQKFNIRTKNNGALINKRNSFF